jgi:hypothetical protein
MAKKNKKSNVMAVDIFERDYAEAIEWRTEQILGDREVTNEDYDEAYEQAVEEVANENGITLL